jgi:1,4-alpha-glucan branching enzyme
LEAVDSVLEKVPETDGTTRVTFRLPPSVHAARVMVCGEFNDWDETRHAMERADDGGFSMTIRVPSGRRYRFRYLMDGHRWENDWAADDYVPNDFGGQDSVVEA